MIINKGGLAHYTTKGSQANDTILGHRFISLPWTIVSIYLSRQCGILAHHLDKCPTSSALAPPPLSDNSRLHPMTVIGCCHPTMQRPRPEETALS